MKKKGFLSFVYHNPLGFPLRMIFRMSWFSRVMGSIFTLPLSRFLIPSLARIYGISLSTYEVPEGGFLTLNDFFVRRSRPDCRLFPVDANHLGSPADACVEIFQSISSTQDFCVKGYHANLEKLFGPHISDFIGGDVCFCRLRFSDYHRFHFFDDGTVIDSELRNGPLYSVDNAVLDTGLWIDNKSHCMRLRTKNFGDVLWLEVGATNVGSIINHKKTGESFVRGEEKGYFQLGGSAVLLVFQSGMVTWENDILASSSRQEEYEVITGKILGKRS